MGREKVANPRNQSIAVWCREAEKLQIKQKAKMVGLSSSVYLRNIGLNYPIKSTVDQLALNQLINARADLGRLGGLFKMWLSKDHERKMSMGGRSYESIDELVSDIEKKQGELLSIAKKIMQVNK